MKKGLVIEITKNYAIVLCDKGDVDKIKIKPNMKVGQKLFYFDEDIVQVKNSGSLNISRFMKGFGTIAAAFIFIFTMFYNFAVDKTYVVVSLDINPSIQISADKDSNIIKIEGMNEDGKSIDFSKIKGEKLNDGIEKIKNILVEKKYLENNRDVLVAVAILDENSDDSEYEENIKKSVNSTFVTENIAYVKVDDKEDVAEAKQEKISLGRYEAYKLSSDTNANKTEVAVAPVKEITEKIKDNDKVIYWDKTEKTEVTKTDVNTDTKKDNENQNSSTTTTSSDSNIKEENKSSDNTTKKEENKETTTDKPADSDTPKIDAGVSDDSKKVTEEPKKDVTEPPKNVIDVMPETPVDGGNANKKVEEDPKSLKPAEEKQN